MDPIVEDPRVAAEVAARPYPLLFATVSGAHLYGFPSPDSDVDLRGVHVLPKAEVLGLDTGPETITLSHMREGMEVDLVTHDVKKFFTLLLRRNGYVLEQVCSPLVVHTTSEHGELLALVPRLLTRHHAHHYLGFAASAWRLFQKEQPPRVKPLLYVYRVLLTGIHLMRSGEVEATSRGSTRSSGWRTCPTSWRGRSRAASAGPWWAKTWRGTKQSLRGCSPSSSTRAT